MSTPEGYTVCQYCRMPHPGGVASCPSCGAALDVRRMVSRSGWTEQPPMKDMTRIQFGQSRVQIEGKYVPIADFRLVGPEWIYFSHHALLHMDPTIQLGNTSLAGGWNRMLSGMPLVMVEARGPGGLALSGDQPGDLIAMPLAPGRVMWVREHRFLTATGNVTYTWQNTNVWYTTGTGDDKETHYPLGQFGDLFTAQQGPGLLLLHSPGNTFIRDLQPGERILVQPGALLYRDVSVQMHLHIEYPAGVGSNLFSWGSSFSQRNIWLRLIGPGRVAVSSVFHHTSSDSITRNSAATVHRW